MEKLHRYEIPSPIDETEPRTFEVIAFACLLTRRHGYR
jgi:hypothetical protein